MTMPRDAVKPATLGGRVTRASDAAPIRNAVVVVAADRTVPAEGRSLKSVRTSEDGRWSVGEVVPGNYILTVNAIGFSPATRELLDVAAGEQRDGIDAALSNGGVLVTGAITTEKQEPIGSAEVTAHRDGGGSYFVATSGKDGRYELSLGSGNYQLAITHDDYRRTWKNISVGDVAVTANFTLVRGGVIRGHVVARDTGSPVANATVTGLGGRDISTAQTDSNGTFILHSLHDGAITIDARATGYASVTPTVVDLDNAEHLDNVEVKVDPASSILGRVVAKDDTTRGISGVAVSAMKWEARPWRAQGVSDAAGNFEIAGLVPGQYVLSADRRGMIFGGGVQVDVVDADVTGVTIEMRAGVNLSGRVEPPLVAQVAIARVGDDILANDKDAVSIATARTESDATGAFMLRDVPAGEFEISAMATDGKSGKVTVTVNGGDQSGLAIPLSPRASMSGRVIDSNGKPVAGMYVVNYRTDVPLVIRMRRDGIHRGAITAADGSFRIVGLDAGAWLLSVDDPNGISDARTLEVELSDGAERTGITLTVQASDEQIRGTVLGPDRKPVIGAEVRAMREVPGKDRQQYVPRRNSVRTNETGSFVIDKLRAGTYTLIAEGLRGSSKASISGVKTGDSPTITLAPLSSLTINVTEQGAPSGKARVTCWGPAGNLGLDADTDGSHTFDDVAQGEYRCDAVGDKGTAHATIVVREEPATLTMILEPYGSLTGIAVDVQTDKPVARISVVGHGSGAETDADGRFTLERVPAGPGRLLLMPKDQIGIGYDQHRYTAIAGQRVDLGRLQVVPPRNGDVGTFGLGLEVRGDTVIVTRVRPTSPAERAGIKIGDSIAGIDGKSVAALGAPRTHRLLASEAVGVGQTVEVLLASGLRTTMTAIKW
ncbi:MAG: carboxypeptidase regulatory-like domain-containing protein [Deltaproteobacteria bacterium]|nr:carboxypeptidase regulatory-like domain-containing protein [Deltaproteobacteria bacterium]